MELIRNHLQEQRKLTHDFQNHLYMLQELLQNPKYTEEALAYIEQLTEKNETKVQIVHTKNPIIDALLNQKYMVCKKEQIPIFFELNDLHTFEIEQEKIVVILSNILDNAIESCRKQGSERFIKVKFLTGDSGTILSVQNTANIKNVNYFKGVTTKANPLLHGYGLKNALQAVKDSGELEKSPVKMRCFNLLLFGIRGCWEQKQSVGNMNIEKNRKNAILRL